jgi:hypothetical protein
MEYFSHDYDAREDEKIIDLMGEMGWAGYGQYWGILELLYKNNGKMRAQYNRIAFALNTQPDSIKAIVEDFGLFEIEDGLFYSEAALRRLAERNDKSAKARESARIRWENANAKRTQCDGNAKKERKGKKIKEKEPKGGVIILPFDSKRFLEYWAYWKDYKKREFRFNYKTPQSEQAAAKKLAELAGGDESKAVAIIEQSLANGWKGFFPLDKKAGNTSEMDEYKKDLERRMAE